VGLTASSAASLNTIKILWCAYRCNTAGPVAKLQRTTFGRAAVHARSLQWCWRWTSAMTWSVFLPYQCSFNGSVPSWT